ncbi:MAG: alanine racemase [Flavobacteriales bacterium]|nr:alanine racemase [Flavobacteriales bacterium]MDW8432704.1 alanine racemase [Flavobacteriales bacterium]
MEKAEVRESYTLSHIAHVVRGQLQGPDVAWTQKPRLVFDTRQIWDGPSTVFWAIKGPSRHGEDFVTAAFEAGVPAVVVSDQYKVKPEWQQKSYVVVPNVLEALQKLAAWQRRRFPEKNVVAITGSNGKTIVKEWLARALLSLGKKVCRSPLSYNSQLGVPISVWQLDAGHDFGLFEAGISKPGEMGKLEAIIQPTHGIFTNLGSAHSAHFEGDLHKLQEKLILFRNCKYLVFRNDRSFPGEYVEAFCRERGIHMWSWGAQGVWRPKIKKVSSNRTEIVWDEGGIILPFSEEYNIENALHVLAFLVFSGVPVRHMEALPAQWYPLPMRLSVDEGLRNTILINDTYSSDPESFQIALGKLAEVAGLGPKTAVITDFDDIKQDWAYWKKVLEEMRRPLNIQRIITVGAGWLEHVQGNPGFICLKTTEELIDRLAEFNFHDETILFKGARKYALERVIGLLSRKTQQTWVEISADALRHNVHQYRVYLKERARIMLMLKAAAYGSGEGMAFAIRQVAADYVAVAYPDEGVELRRRGLQLPVMVMHVPPAFIPTALEYRLEPVLHSAEYMQEWVLALRDLGAEKVPAHFEVDTGMHRLGFPHDTMSQVWPQMVEAAQKFFHVRSIFSHLSGADDPAMENFTRKQFERFLPWVQQAKQAFGQGVLAHIANSAAAFRFPEMALDMVRLGIGFYGYGEGQAGLDLRGTFSWYTTVLAVKLVPPGEPVGYGLEGVADRERKIAVLGLGYADGFSRRLGRGVWSFRFSDGRAPTVGRICMDMTLCDVTELQVQPGDTAAVFHPGWGPEEMGRLLGTIPYEVLTGINLRVRRIIVKE